MKNIPIVVLVISGMIYHISSKGIDNTANPFLSLAITYVLALMLAFAAFKFTNRSSFRKELYKVNWAAYAIGLSLVGLEFGWVMMYRNGWDISIALLLASVLLSIALFIIGVLAYKEKISAKKTIGVLFCIAGIILIKL